MVILQKKSGKQFSRSRARNLISYTFRIDLDKVEWLDVDEYYLLLGDCFEIPKLYTEPKFDKKGNIIHESTFNIETKEDERKRAKRDAIRLGYG